MHDTFLTDGELTRLLDQPDLGTKVGIRNMAIILLMLETGAKSGELLGKEGDSDTIRGGLRLRDVHGESTDRRILLHKASDGSCRTVGVPASAARFLDAWLAVRPRCASDLVFVTSRGTRILNRYIRKTLHDYGVAAGIATEVKPSVLRHTYARRRLAAGADLEQLAESLGHKHIISSVRYLFPEGPR
ncbi:MAG: tyrosine-type recombinase/integrase [Alkalispirochaeta sp.]